MNATHNTPPVLMIGGYGRSGSSAVDRLIATTLGGLSAGELCHLFALADKGNCTCGMPYQECSVWGPCLEVVSQSVELKDAALLTREVELGRPSNLALAEYRSIWSSLLTSVVTTTGVGFVVDSSKTAGGRLRARRLAQVGVDLRFLWLRRRSIGPITAEAWGNNNLIEQGVETPNYRRSRALRATAGLLRANLSAARFAARHPLWAHLQYESLSSQPEAQVVDVCRQLRLEPSGSGVSGHQVAGNRLLRESPDGSFTVRVPKGSSGPLLSILGGFGDIVSGAAYRAAKMASTGG